jgi:hypothetical protein
MTKNLFLDDIRIPSTVNTYMPELGNGYFDAKWDIVRNYGEFVDYLKVNGLPNMVSFDHDLADVEYDSKSYTETFTYQEKTGFDCAKYLVDYCIDNDLLVPNFVVHSQNPVGNKNIEGLLQNFKKFQTK